MSHVKLADPQLPCHGCVHSASYARYPGHPSGERPCGFCVRNPDHEAFGWFDEIDPSSKLALWYDGTPAIKTPMDNYIATDRLAQEDVFVKAAQRHGEDLARQHA